MLLLANTRGLSSLAWLLDAHARLLDEARPAGDVLLDEGRKCLLRAARSEYAKLEKPLTDTEIVGWLDEHS